ncbi:epoxide hydrolase N-termina [Backusella circina FSU 941]|nr:epoxide hydrolase N-termina [Backusella circina FSU 941]
MTIKAIIFDIGGVCVGSPMAGIHRFEKEKGFPRNYLNVAIVKQGDQGAFQKFERGEIQFDEFCKLFGDQLSHPSNKVNYKEYLKRTGKDVPKVIPDVIVNGKELFKVMIGESNRVDKDVLRVIENLRASKKFTIAALTNSYELPKNNPKEMEEMGMGVVAGLRHLFDYFIESQVAGMRKPDPNFFIYACDLIGIKPEEAIFLDDIGVNIEAAKNLGITTIQVKMGHSYNAIKELESLTGLDLHSTIESKL